MRLYSILLLIFALTFSPAHAGTAAIFGGGPLYNADPKVMSDLKASGFNTVVLWTIHVDPKTSDLIYNDARIVSGGAYVGKPAWPGQLAALKQGTTSVNRIEVCVGSAGVDDFGSIRDLMKAQGDGTDALLVLNFKALKDATGADAICFDDETLYDEDATVRFGKMLASLGYKITLTPYSHSDFWEAVASRLFHSVDAVYLQCYEGGAGNDPSGWSDAFRPVIPMPGLWCRHGSQGDSPADVERKMSDWKHSAGIKGGFMWLFDDMLQNTKDGTMADYAHAIHHALGDDQPAPDDPDAILKL